MRSGTASGGSIGRSKTPTGSSLEISPLAPPKADSERTIAHPQVGFAAALSTCHEPRFFSVISGCRLAHSG